MTYFDSPSRRTFLRIASSTAAVSGLAGCIDTIRDLDNDHANTSDNDGSHESTDGNHDHSNDDLSDTPDDEADVAMITDDSGHHFEPHLVWIETGGTVTWTNDSGSHTTTAYHPEYDNPLRVPEEAEPWNSGMYSEKGVTFEHTFDVDGVYDYFCVPHEHRAMVGTVIVGDPDPHEQPGLEEPQEELPAEAQELFKELNEKTNELLGHTH